MASLLKFGSIKAATHILLVSVPAYVIFPEIDVPIVSALNVNTAKKSKDLSSKCFIMVNINCGKM
jgi:hypothetical protein